MKLNRFGWVNLGLLYILDKWFGQKGHFGYFVGIISLYIYELIQILEVTDIIKFDYG